MTVTALSVAQNQNFMAIALDEALKTISKDTGISLEALINQFPTNSNLQQRAAEMVSLAANVVADNLNK